MKVTPRRQRSDSAAAAIAATQAAAMGPLKPPKHVALRAGDRPFWDAIMLARARDTWTGPDLTMAGNLARTQADIEVDFVLESRSGHITGIEVKASASIDSNAFKGLRHLQETEGDKFQRGVVLYAGREVVPFGDKLWAVPLSVWWGVEN